MTAQFERQAKGVFFHRDDYAGFWRRLVVDLIDVAIDIALVHFGYVLLELIYPDYSLVHIHAFVPTSLAASMDRFVSAAKSLGF